MSASLAPKRLPDLFNVNEKRGGAWDLMSRDKHHPIHKGRKGGGS